MNVGDILLYVVLGWAACYTLYAWYMLARLLIWAHSKPQTRKREIEMYQPGDEVFYTPAGEGLIVATIKYKNEYGNYRIASKEFHLLTDVDIKEQAKRFGYLTATPKELKKIAFTKKEKKMNKRSKQCECGRTLYLDENQAALPKGMNAYIFPCECGKEVWFEAENKQTEMIGEPMTLISNTKQDKQIAASSRYARLTFWSAIVFFSGLGNLIVSKAPAAWCFVTNALGEFFISISGK